MVKTVTSALVECNAFDRCKSAAEFITLQVDVLCVVVA